MWKCVCVCMCVYYIYIYIWIQLMIIHQSEKFGKKWDSYPESLTIITVMLQ